MRREWLRGALGGLLLAMFILVVAFATAVKAGPAEIKPLDKLPDEVKAKLPSVINVGNLPVGSPGVVATLAISDSVSKLFGLSLKCRPYSSMVAKFKALEVGDVATIYTSMGTRQFYFLGLKHYHGWKPRKVRLLWYALPIWAGVGVTPDIKSWKDVPGRKWSYPAYGPGHASLVKAYFAYHKIDPDSLIKVPAPSYTKAIEMVKDGLADLALITVTCPKTNEAVELGKMRILGFGPPEEKEAWARLQAMTPAYSPSWAEVGCVRDNPLWMSGGNYAYQVLDELDENLVYALAYGFHKTYPKWKNVTLEAPYLNLKETLNVAHWKQMAIPYHRGAVKYFKDIGAWTPELEAYQEMAEITEARVFDVRRAWVKDIKAK